MKTLLFLILATITTFAAPVRVVFDDPVRRGDVLHESATLNYFYVDSDQLTLYTSLGSVAMCYPLVQDPEPSPEDTTAHSEWMWEQERHAAQCPIVFSPADMATPAFQFIKTTVPARFKAWAEGEAP